MRKLFIILAAVSIMAGVCAQSPQKMSYQAVIRNAANALVTNQSIGLQVTILQGSVSGTEVFKEIYNPNPVTNANGLVTIEIGSGLPFLGAFSSINWANGPYFIKTETDPTGGTSYTITTTCQLLSVPYALHSLSSANGFARVYSETDTRPVLYENGNIGMGTPYNWAKLDINGRLNIGSGMDTWGSQIVLNAGALKNGKAYALTSTGGNAGEGQGKLVFGYNKGNIMVMDSGFNVGIGTNNPVSRLDVNGIINVNSNKITNVAAPVSANDAANKAYVDNSYKHFIGESYGGGIVFYVYDNGQHGLIAATSDQSSGIRWYGGTYTNTRARAKGVGAGRANTAIIIANQGSFDGAPFAAAICNELLVTVDDVDYGDWYLPSITELMLMYLNKDKVGGLGGSTYWSSTEYEGDWAFVERFADGVPAVTDKGGHYPVRAIRAF